jgi:hypothetical protein
MARQGRKRKFGHRWSNGNLKPPNAAARGLDLQSLEDAEKSIVLAQPHRFGHNADQLCESPLGRLVMRWKLRRQIFDAAIEWGKFMRRWLAIKGIPQEIHAGAGKGAWPSEKTVAEWELEVCRVDRALKKISISGFTAVSRLAIPEREIDPACESDAVAVLIELARQTSRLPRNSHPFLS